MLTTHLDNNLLSQMVEPPLTVFNMSKINRKVKHMKYHNSPQVRTRKEWVILIAVIGTTMLLSGCGTQTPKVYRVGILTSNPSFAAIGDGFKDKMAELGYIENENIVYVVENPDSNPADQQRSAEKFVEDKVDLIFAYPAPEAVAVNTAINGTDIPALFSYAQIEGGTLVKSVREPGGSMTGVRYPGPEMMSRRLEILLEIVPTTKRVWISYDKNGPIIPVALEALRSTASSLGVTLVEVPITKLEELGEDLAAREQSADLGLDAIITMPDEFNTSPAGFAVLSKFAAKHNLPLAAGIGYMAKEGALFINTTDLTHVGELAAPLADKILKGTPPGNIPVVTPEQRVVINYQVAKDLGVTVPQGLLELADEVIE
jgi:putative ABC transport system substrate-binding protein